MKKRFKSILITGASSGIGAALARYYAMPGVQLALSGRNQERLEAIAQQCRDKGAIVRTVCVSVTDQLGMADWISTVDHETPLDLVIANAGISGGNGGDASGESVAQARAIFDVNVTGVFNTIEPVLPAMLARRNGHIAVVSSLAGFRGYPSAPGYCASKGAVRFYGEALRGALYGSGVDVSVICPGFVRSRITDTNDFRMPMLMEADQAAQIIAKGLSCNAGRIAFPWPMLAMTWFMAILPDVLAQPILRFLPAKR